MVILIIDDCPTDPCDDMLDKAIFRLTQSKLVKKAVEMAQLMSEVLSPQAFLI